MRAKTFAYLFASSFLAAAIAAESHPLKAEASQVTPSTTTRTPVNGTNRPLVQSGVDVAANDASRTPVVNGTNRPLIQAY